ncbi:hypothetical protein BOTBODRAFT_36373 [Botryobasidium botryosum FD-172 SS1]|uniref:J domain-containing protein n=1 Tax=Botryobasidium botryosum (strain FD-172 SS1) TaxID=930990 RepID=A0A067M3C3_BOTB1|nr:hypothetical protein BOTBODRAFT_36373 [Botryobasidium botryosum FD-172 SS1]
MERDWESVGPEDAPFEQDLPVQDEQQDQEDPNHQSLYAVLNVPTTATTEQIREKYKALAVLLHPDKQSDESRRKIAEAKFRQVQRAYEVLTSPQRRAVYDALGEEGLKTNWEVGQKFKSPEELRAEFDRLTRKRTLATAESLVRARGNLTCVIDARSLFSSDEQSERKQKAISLLRPPGVRATESRTAGIRRRLRGVQAANFSVNHSFHTALTPATQFVITGTASRRGQPNFLGTVRHQYSSRLWIEAETALLNPQRTTVKGGFHPNPSTALTVQAQALHASPLPPPLTISLARKLWQDSPTEGVITYFTGSPSIPFTSSSLLIPSALNVALQSPNWSTGVQLSFAGTNLTSSWTTRPTKSLAVRFGAALGFTGFEFSIGGSDRLDFGGAIEGGLGVGCTVSAGSNGVVLKFRLTRPGQRITLPIVLSSQANPKLALFATVIPALGFIALERYIQIPARRGSKRYARLREQYAELIAERKREAEEVVVLMREQVARKVEAEQVKNGLIILEATYGASSPNHDIERLDVTTPVQALVSSSQLAIPGGRSKSGLLGFYDPCMGERKTLRIRYLFRNRTHEVAVDDMAGLLLPLKGHLVN